MSALDAGRTNVLKHAEHRSDTGLVVVGAVRAVGEVLKDGGDAQDHQRQGGHDADDPHKAAERLGKKREGLEQGAHGDGERAVLARLPEHGHIRSQRGRVERVLVRRVVVSHDDDGAGALHDHGAGTLVERHDVLAAGRRPEASKKVVPQVLEDEQRDRSGHKHEANGGENGHTDASQNNAQEDQGIQHGRHDAAEGLRVELLDARLDVVLTHEVGDGLGCLELLLAAGRTDARLFVEVVHVVMCHGHCEDPFEQSSKGNFV